MPTPSLLLFTAIGPRLAHAGDCVTTLDRAREIGRAVAAENPAVEVTEYAGAEAKKLLAAINATPPVTEFEADAILVIDPKDDLPFCVALSLDGCVKGASRVARETWADMLEAAFGDRL